MLLVYNLRKFTPLVLASRLHTAPSLLEKNKSFSQLTQEREEPSESSSNKRQSLFMRRKLHEGLNKTLSIFRDLDPKYSFLKISPPVPNIDVQQISSSFWLKFASHTQDRLDLLEPQAVLVFLELLAIEDLPELLVLKDQRGTKEQPFLGQEDYLVKRVSLAT